MVNKLSRFPKTIFLKIEFRNLLFCRAYAKAGESLGALGRAMGYPARDGLNGTTRDMWLGRRGIPAYRIKRLAQLSDLSIKSIQAEIIPKEQNIEAFSWTVIYNEYKTKMQDKCSTSSGSDGS